VRRIEHVLELDLVDLVIAAYQRDGELASVSTIIV